VQPASQLFDTDVLTLAQDTRRVAESIDDPKLAARLYQIADEVLCLAYLGDRSNTAELADALTHLNLDWTRCPAP
jgi:hypothetical protein